MCGLMTLQMWRLNIRVRIYTYLGVNEAACGVDAWLWRHSRVRAHRRGCHPPNGPSVTRSTQWVGVGCRSAGPELQLEGLGDVEKATDGRLEAHGAWWARALQREGLQDGGEQEEEFGPSQALPKADALTWREERSGAGPAVLPARHVGRGGPRRYLRRRARMPRAS